ncbi:hypothetical protein BpHYR1_040892 [Brachionus plicatilis]|uniref:Uncharacterized protein n=1 Tax=Brachionus plicatilis TaxID=10195 RepID=A0A3M7RS29_BRAPC|nr:hypothetical protein BpHYR1_040892 [Brachionus plicatilis]
MVTDINFSDKKFPKKKKWRMVLKMKKINCAQLATCQWLKEDILFIFFYYKRCTFFHTQKPLLCNA